MKSLRLIVLMMVVGAFPAFLPQAVGQQEVDPDHFDQPAANVNASAKASSNHKPASSHHRASQVRLASRHSSSRVHHHPAHTSA
jgi:hypothetical protein